MAVAGDSRSIRNPQKAHVAWTGALWANSILAREASKPVALSLTGDYFEDHMKELLTFHRRIFFELDDKQLRKMRRAFARLPRGYKKGELQNTEIVKGNIFETARNFDGDGGYYDWDITGTIDEAVSYGLENAVWDAFQAPGTRCLALTVSTRPVGMATTIGLWESIVDHAGSAWSHERVWEFAPFIKYGRPALGGGNMMMVQAVIRDK